MEITTSFLRKIEKPGRYFSPFIHTFNKSITEKSPKILIIFPDLFEVAQSHSGIKIMYNLFSNYGAFVDFGFSFREDMEKEYEKEGALLSFMHNIDYREFDLIAVSFQYQLAYPTLLRMLKIAKIPIKSAERNEKFPIVAGGGPAITNPEPIAPFLDLTFAGEIEPVAERIVNILQSSADRDERLSALSLTDGFFNTQIDYFAEKKDQILKAVAKDMDSETIIPTEIPVFGLRTVHDKFVVEIQRGCTRGCRFCMAGMFYRPHRERSASVITDALEKCVLSTGNNEASFLSLSASDHSQFRDILEYSFIGKPREFAVSLPSLRTEAISEEILEIVGKGRKSSFTLAPESGSERLRNVINKGNSTEDLLKSIHSIFKKRWQHIKLYFMLGLPTEKDEDLQETVQLIGKICGIAKGYHRKNSITASFSTFVPQPFTPFQWEEMISSEEI